MRASNAFSCRPAIEIRVGFTPDETSCVLINRVICRNVTKVCHCQERRNVGIVHYETVAESVSLECVYLAVLRMVVNRIFFEGGLYFGSQAAALFSKSRIAVYSLKDFRGFFQ